MFTCCLVNPTHCQVPLRSDIQCYSLHLPVVSVMPDWCILLTYNNWILKKGYTHWCFLIVFRGAPVWGCSERYWNGSGAVCGGKHHLDEDQKNRFGLLQRARTSGGLLAQHTRECDCHDGAARYFTADTRGNFSLQTTNIVSYIKQRLSRIYEHPHFHLFLPFIFQMRTLYRN